MFCGLRARDLADPARREHLLQLAEERTLACPLAFLSEAGVAALTLVPPNFKTCSDWRVDFNSNIWTNSPRLMHFIVNKAIFSSFLCLAETYAANVHSFLAILQGPQVGECVAPSHMSPSALHFRVDLIVSGMFRAGVNNHRND